MITALEFYSGIGGMRCALASVDPSAVVVRAMDINHAANEVYAHNFPESPAQINLEHVSARELDSYAAELWMLAPPCQPFTRQGHQKGAEDPRSRSFLHIFRQLQNMQNPPQWLILENVVGFEASDLHKLLQQTLSTAGYCQQEFILSPKQYGVPYSRPRYFCLACKGQFPVKLPAEAQPCLCTPALLLQLKASHADDATIAVTAQRPLEDQRLAELVQIHGPKRWSQIAADLGTKGSKQCRRRWKNFLSLDDRKQGSWTPEEDARLLDGHKRHGNKWTLIAQEIGGRTDNAVKNRWAALEKKRKFGDETMNRPILRANDLLAVRRIISKDQPRQRLANIVDAPWVLDYQNDMQHTVYSTPPADYTPLQGVAACGAASDLPGHQSSEVVAPVPGGTAAEVPYNSLRPQPTIEQMRLQREMLAPAESALTQDLHGLDVRLTLSREDDGLISVSRQRAVNTIVGLADEQHVDMSDLYNIFNAHPGPAQPAGPLRLEHRSVPAGRLSPLPWATRQEQGQPQQQLDQQQLALPASDHPQQPFQPMQLPVVTQQMPMLHTQHQHSSSPMQPQPQLAQQKPGMMLLPSQQLVPQQPGRMTYSNTMQQLLPCNGPLSGLQQQLHKQVLTTVVTSAGPSGPSGPDFPQIPCSAPHSSAAIAAVPNLPRQGSHQVNAGEGRGQSSFFLEQPQQHMGPAAAPQNLGGPSGEPGHWGPDEVKQLLEALGEHQQHCQSRSYQQQGHTRDEEVEQEALLSRAPAAVELQTAGSGIVGGLGTLVTPSSIMPVQQAAQQGYHHQGASTLHI
eukprot:gene6692-6915_t